MWYRRVWMAVLTLVVLTGATGCFKTRMIVRIRPDGSGDLVVEQLMSDAAIRQVEQQMDQMIAMVQAMGGEARTRKSMKEVMSDEAVLRRVAPMYGDVELVSVQPVEEAGFVGARTVYRFKDIGRIRVPLNDGPRGQVIGAAMLKGENDELPPVEAASDDASDIVFSWEPKESGGTLKVRMPPMEKVELAEDPDWKPPQESDFTRQLAAEPQFAQALGLQSGMSHEEALKKMFGDVEMLIVLEAADGQIRSTTAQFAASDRKNTFTLIRFNFREILNSPKGLRLFSDEKSMQGPNPPIADGVPGMQVEQGEVQFDITL